MRDSIDLDFIDVEELLAAEVAHGLSAVWFHTLGELVRVGHVFMTPTEKACAIANGVTVFVQKEVVSSSETYELALSVVENCPLFGLFQNLIVLCIFCQLENKSFRILKVLILALGSSHHKIGISPDHLIELACFHNNQKVSFAT